MIILESDAMLLWPEGSESDHSSGETYARLRKTVTIGASSGEAILVGEQLKMQAELRPSLSSPELRAGSCVHRYVIKYPEVSK